MKKKKQKTKSHYFPLPTPQLCCFSVRNAYSKPAGELLDRLCSTPLLAQGTAPCGHRVIWGSQEAPRTESSVQLRESVNSRAFSRTAPQAFCGDEHPLLPWAQTRPSTLGLFSANTAPAPAVSSPSPPDSAASPAPSAEKRRMPQKEGGGQDVT